MTLTPGAYLKYRRTAAGLSLADVAARLGSEPRLAQHVRASWIDLIEADAQPASFDTIVALRSAYPFDLLVLARLAAIQMGLAAEPPQLCLICAAGDDLIVELREGAAGTVEELLCARCFAARTVPAQVAAA